jgi:hypothetical protein
MRSEAAFAPSAFDESIGKEITVNGFGDPKTGKLVKADIAPDGHSAELTIELPDSPDILQVLGMALSPAMSIGFNSHE